MKTIDSIPYFSNELLSGLDISTNDVIKSIETLIAGCADQTVWSAPKSVILPGDGRYIMAALAASDDPPLLAVKTVVLNPRNPECGLPQINGLVTMLNSETGLPVAILDGRWITAVRTAGLSAVAAKYMARGDSSVASFIGCGVQASSHLQAFSEMFPLEEVRILGRGKANIDRLAREVESLSLLPVICKSSEEALNGSDLIVSSVTHTIQREPFLDATWLKAGSFSAITDLGVPWVKESLSVINQLVIDDLEQEAKLPNKLVAPELVKGDLSGLVLRKFKGREQESDRTAFIFRGHALGDLALAVLAYQKAIELKQFPVS